MKESICSQRGSVSSFLLSALKNGDKYAYEIGKAVKEISGGKYVLKEASLYSGLKRLEAQGFLTSYTTELDNGLTRRYYSLTQSGKEKLSSIDFLWDSEQKDSILQSINNTIIDETINQTALEETAQSSTSQNQITINDEDNNLIKHTIHENQQNLFALFNNSDAELATTSQTTNQTAQTYENTAPNNIKNVDELEFYSLKNNYKNQAESFLDSVNNDGIKMFNAQQSAKPAINDSYFNNSKQPDSHVIEKLEEKTEDNFIKKANPELTAPLENTDNTVKPIVNNEPQINISDIFGDLCIKENSSKILTDSNKTDDLKQIEQVSAIINKADATNYNNINCTLEVPIAAQKNEAVEETASASPEDNKIYETEDQTVYEETKTFDVSSLLGNKPSLYKPSITVNNSVLYANGKIDLEKPSFETKFSKKGSEVFETRQYVPVAPNQIKSTHISINRIKFISGLLIFLLQLILTAVIYFAFDKTPFKNFTVIQTVCYACSLGFVALFAIAQTITFICNKYKVVKKLDYKTNIFFKFLFGLCIISSLFIVYKFFEINIQDGFYYLILLPTTSIFSINIEELFKFLLSKSINC